MVSVGVTAMLMYLGLKMPAVIIDLGFEDLLTMQSRSLHQIDELSEADSNYTDPGLKRKYTNTVNSASWSRRSKAGKTKLHSLTQLSLEMTRATLQAMTSPRTPINDTAVCNVLATLIICSY